MKKTTTIIIVLFSILSINAKNVHQLFVENNYSNLFEKAYKTYPDIPRGMLEAVSFTMTRFHHRIPVHESCMGIPKTYGIMGLTLDGKDYFRNNLNLISNLSEISVKDIMNSPEKSIMAYAKAYNYFVQKKHCYSLKNQKEVLAELSELPYNDLEKDFALNTYLYEIYWFLTNKTAQQKYHLPNYNIDLYEVFGANLDILKSTKIILDSKNNVISDGAGHYYQTSGLDKSINSTDYPPAIEDLTTCNFSSRNGTAITAVAIHDTEGSYAGAISWFHNCNANASAHYVIRSSDGQVTQVVLEADKAWHVRDENPYTIGIEHEGYRDETGWYTDAMYNSSADLVIDIVNSGYNIPPLRTAYFPWSADTYYYNDGIPGECIRIKGHQHFPNNTHNDPGPNWDWDFYYKLINEPTDSPIIYTTSSGTIYDDGGANANYSNDQRTVYVINPQNAQSIDLNIQQFDVEENWDYLYIYEGDNVFSNLIGYYTSTNIPSSFHINAPFATIEFRSDCATNAPGFTISWTSNIADTVAPQTSITDIPSPYASDDFQATFNDIDNASGIKYRFYSISDYNGQEYSANPYKEFMFDDFNILNGDWSSVSGNWTCTNNTLLQDDESNANTNINRYVNQNNSDRYLYHFKLKLSGSDTNRRAGLHYMCNNPSLSNRGNSYLAYFRLDDDRIEFYKSTNDTLTSVKTIDYDFNADQAYDIKIMYNKTIGSNAFWINDVCMGWWVDSTPIQTGDYVSFRTGNCIAEIDSFEVFKQRGTQETIAIGNTNQDDIRYEDANGFAAGKIRALAIDSANNISNIVEKEVHVDYNFTNNKTINKSDISIYPNPASKTLFISTNTENNNVKIFDSKGSIVLNKYYKSKQINIDVSKFKAGSYVVKINNKKYSIVKK